MNAAKQPPGARGGGGSLPVPARAAPIKKEEDVDTDDELCTHHTDGRYQHVLKKEEDVDTDDELQAADDAETGTRKKKLGRSDAAQDMREANDRRSASSSFQRRLQELTAYKAKYGHLKVKESIDKSLAQFCRNVRQARKGRGKMKLTEERIATLNDLGFDWAPKLRGNLKADTFQERIEELKAYKAKQGHLSVKESEDKSLAKFCGHIRHARRGKGNIKLTEERIASMDDLGFDWGVKRAQRVKSFQERLDGLRAYKAKHGHTNVKKSEDKSLYAFCKNVRSARRNPGSKTKLTKERIDALDALEFEWEPRKVRSFQERVEELEAHKAEHGHLDVKESEDSTLASFCRDIRHARRKPESSKTMKLTEERIAALSALGFDWTVSERSPQKSFEERLEALKAYKAEHGHINVEKSEDKSL